jgi:TonB-dependent starch-binding outer membrane protein SusC
MKFNLLFAEISLSSNGYKKLASMIIFSMMGMVIFAQTIKGKIIDENNEPIIGVTIVEEGTTNGTISDIDGNYSIMTVTKTPRLTFSFIGYEAQTQDVGDRSEVNVSLSKSVSRLEEVVVTGYLPTKRKDVLGAVSSLKPEEIQQIVPVSAFDAIQGRMSGVQILNNGGPGEGFDIQIRGLSTFSGGGGPLFVVDGQQLDNINNLDPTDFASIEVLKDASTAAIYGSRAANGVVMITTKSGQIGKPVIDISQTYTLQNINSGVSLANTKERLFYERVRQPAIPTIILDSLNVLNYISNDLNDQLMQQGSRSLTNLSISGGSGGTKYFWNTGYLDQKGIVVNSDYKRLNSTLRLENKFSSKANASTRLTATLEERNGLNENTVFQQMVERIPYFPVFEPNGTLTVEIAGRQNPLAEALFTTRKFINYRFQIFNSFDYKILPFLTYKFNAGANARLGRNNNFDPTIVQTPGRPATGTESTNLDNDYQIENLLYFNKKFNNAHTFSGVAGYTFQKWSEDFSRLDAISFVSDNISTFNNVLELNTGNTISTKQARALSGLFGNLQYNYKEKYLLGGVIRRDGSSRFGVNKRYGIFPSYSIGWRVSNEGFMKSLDNVVSNLLIRAGFGTVGNDRIGNYSSKLLYSPGAFYGGVNGLAPVQLSNLDLGWESTKTTNLAVDLALWKGRVEASVDVWNKKTSDLLYSVPVPAETGFGSVFQNIAGIRNDGVDISLGATPYRAKKFEWRTDFNITFIKNEVTELADPDGFETGNTAEITYEVKVGQPLGNMLTYVNNGVFRYNESNAFAPDGKQLTPVFDDAGKFARYELNGQAYTGEVKKLRLASGNLTLLGGDVWWKDLNGDFIIDADNDRIVAGNGLSNMFGGWNNKFTYNGISLSFLLDYSFGGNIFRLYDQRRNDLNSANETPSPERINGAWVVPGDVAEFASLDRNRVQNRLPNSAYVDKADFIKLRNIRLGYSMPKKLVKSLKLMEGLNASIMLNNFMTFTNYTGYNPELGTRGNALTPGQDALRYPNFREVVFNASLKF